MVVMVVVVVVIVLVLEVAKSPTATMRLPMVPIAQEKVLTTKIETKMKTRVVAAAACELKQWCWTNFTSRLCFQTAPKQESEKIEKTSPWSLQW
jgi:hypothetical protein